MSLGSQLYLATVCPSPAQSLPAARLAFRLVAVTEPRLQVKFQSDFTNTPPIICRHFASARSLLAWTVSSTRLLSTCPATYSSLFFRGKRYIPTSVAPTHHRLSAPFCKLSPLCVPWYYLYFLGDQGSEDLSSVLWLVSSVTATVLQLIIMQLAYGLYDGWSKFLFDQWNTVGHGRSSQ